jgi:glycerol-3-phosphate dehydrogenase
MSQEVDVLIIGGGLTGLLILKELKAKYRSVALVTESEIGHGQSLHMHGKYHKIIVLLEQDTFIMDIHLQKMKH